MQNHRKNEIIILLLEVAKEVIKNMYTFSHDNASVIGSGIKNNVSKNYMPPIKCQVQRLYQQKN